MNNMKQMKWDAPIAADHRESPGGPHAGLCDLGSLHCEPLYTNHWRLIVVPEIGLLR